MRSSLVDITKISDILILSGPFCKTLCIKKTPAPGKKTPCIKRPADKKLFLGPWERPHGQKTKEVVNDFNQSH